MPVWALNSIDVACTIFNWSLIVVPAATAFLANTPIALSDKPVLSATEANSEANSPENLTDEPNILFNDICAATTSPVLTNKSPEAVAASFADATIFRPSAADTPKFLANSPDLPSINLKASTICCIAIAIRAAGPRDFIKFLPIVVAISPAIPNLSPIPRAFDPPSVSDAAVFLAPVIASSIPNLPLKLPNPALLKPFDNPSPISCRDIADLPKGRIASSIFPARSAISAILADSSFNCSF